MGFWQGFTLDMFRRMFRFFGSRFDLQVSDQPQVVFCSVFGGSASEARRRWPGAQLVFFTGENVAPPLGDYDFCMSFSRDISDGRHLRWPLFIPHLSLLGLSLRSLLHREISRPAEERTKFCAFVASNGSVAFRNDFVASLSRYMKVDCPGEALHNMSAAIGPPGDVKRKVRFLSQYRFAVCFENVATRASEGYVTEKVTDAMASGCVPLYWGDHRIGEDFNTDSMVICPEEGKMNETVDRIIHLDRNRHLLASMARAPRFVKNEIPLGLSDAYCDAFFTKVVAACS